MKRRHAGYFGDTPPKHTPRQKSPLPVAGGIEPNEVVTMISKVNHPVRLDELLVFLDLSRRDKRALEAVLEELANEGQLVKLRGGKWIAAAQATLITGVLSVQRSGSGFVTPDPGVGVHKEQGDIFIRQGLLGEAWHGDQVEVALQPGQNRRQGPRSPEGRIVRVIARHTTEIAAYVTRRATSRGTLCRPADPRLDFLLDTDISGLATPPTTGELLLVTPGERLEAGLWAGTATTTLGREDDAAVQERLTKLNHEIPLDFPPDVLAAAAVLEQTPADRDGLPETFSLDEKHLPKNSTSKRQDLRALPFVTIDGEDARDFDDAVFVSAGQDGFSWELWVAIADVSHFVRLGSPLEREARARGNSAYFPLSVEPMLPEVLSNGLCSLRPDEDRLVMAVRISFNQQGIPQRTAFFPGLIRSRARLTYEEVHAELDLPTPDPGSPLLQKLPWLLSARALAEQLMHARHERGSLDFDLPEAHFIVDRPTGKVMNLVRRERFFAHRLIEEFMLAANEATATFLAAHKVPFPYRIHPAPDPERLATLFRTLAATDLVRTNELAVLRDKKGTPSPAALRVLLEKSAGTPQEFLVGRLVLRSMMQARYSPDPGEHFGLASPCYCHFTSPIRRYADLLVHRALKHALGLPEQIPAGGKLLALTDQCNARERAATEAEREITKRLGCLLLEPLTGDTFSGVISGVLDFGFFVELDRMPVEGMVRLETLQDDWYVYDPDRQELVGAGTGRQFRLGQPLTVRLASVHVGRLEINFELLGTTDTGKQSRPPRFSAARAKTPGYGKRGETAAKSGRNNRKGRR